MIRTGKFLKTETQRYALAGAIFGLFFPIIATSIRVVELNLPFNFSSALTVQRSDSLLWIIDTAPFVLSFFASLAGRRQEILQALNDELIRRENELILDRANLEEHVNERTAVLTKKTEQLRAASYVARQTSEVQDLPSLLNNIVKLITNQFGYYHTGIFLINETGDEAVLQAASSEGGQQMIEKGHSLSVGTKGIVGYVAAQKKPRIALDVGTDAVFFNNPDLPMTRSEVALPLVVRNKVLGVLDIQSDIPQAFTMEDIDVLVTLADQVAVAIENSRLLDEAHAALMQLEAVTALRTREAWSQKLQEKERVFTYTPLGLRAEKPSQVNGNASVIPISLRGQKIGSISIARKGDAKWSRLDEDLIAEVATQVGLAVDNIRLLEEATLRARQEQTVGELASRFSQSLDIDTLLQTAARELGQLPDVSEVSVFISQAEKSQQSQPSRSKRSAG
jgi:GAF domain-containing protein